MRKAQQKFDQSSRKCRQSLAKVSPNPRRFLGQNSPKFAPKFWTKIKAAWAQLLVLREFSQKHWCNIFFHSSHGQAAHAQCSSRNSISLPPVPFLKFPCPNSSSSSLSAPTSGRWRKGTGGKELEEESWRKGTGGRELEERNWRQRIGEGTAAGEEGKLEEGSWRKGTGGRELEEESWRKGTGRQGAGGRELEAGNWRKGTAGRDLEKELEAGSWRKGTGGRELGKLLTEMGVVGRELDEGGFLKLPASSSPPSFPPSVLPFFLPSFRPSVRQFKFKFR